ncbi:MAG: hypothetical protein JSS00_10280 [Proteobacteria bacterium]|nr:hypothetical protein [Pseudomonadota bacterium]
MKRLLTGALAFALAATSIPATAFARDRDDWRRDRYEYSHRYYNRGGDAVAAGVIGLALGAVLGAAITDSNRRRHYDRCYDRCGYDGRYDRDAYYDDGYYGGYGGPSLCVVRERRYDPYTGREVFVEDRRPC